MEKVKEQLQHPRYQPRKNYQINISPVRVVDADGTMLGVKPTQEAVALAKSKGLDLVEIAPQAKPPVCKILDYSKHLYEQDKKQREARKKQRAGGLKQIEVSPRIASHDLETKLNHASEFLQKRDKVRVTVIFRGRENQHRDLGQQLLSSWKEKLAAIADTEGGFQMAGNRMSLTFTPKH